MLIALGSTGAVAGDWNQWRGAARDGNAQNSVPLIESLSEEGLKPSWINTEETLRGGGWSSPLVEDGKLFLYSHVQNSRAGVELPPPEYPPLSEEQKEKLSPEEQEQYNQKYAEENAIRRTKQFEFLDRVMQLDAKTGQPLWTREIESRPTQWRHSSTPTLSGTQLFYVGADQQLRCLEAATGKPLWETPLPVKRKADTPISSSPLCVGELVVVLAEHLVAVTKTGEVAWVSPFSHENAIHSSPALWESNGKQRILANVQQIGTVCVAAEDGKELWRIDSHAGHSSPLVQGDLMITYGGSRQGGVRCYRLSETGAELLWKHQRLADQGSSPVIADGRVFVQGERAFACLDLQTGEPIWAAKLDLEQPRYTSPIAADGKVLYTFGGVLCLAAKADEYRPLFDARIGEGGLLASESYFRKQLNMDELERTPKGQEEAIKLWQQHVKATGPRDCVSPAFADGRLYVRLNNGLACYDLRQPKATQTQNQKDNANPRLSSSK